MNNLRSSILCETSANISQQGRGPVQNSLESTRQLSGQMPDTASYITRFLMKDGVPSENSEVGINFCVWIKS